MVVIINFKGGLIIWIHQWLLFYLLNIYLSRNLFIGIIVDAMQSQNTAKEKSATEAKLKQEASLQKEISLLRNEIKELNTHLKK